MQQNIFLVNLNGHFFYFYQAFQSQTDSIAMGRGEENPILNSFLLIFKLN